MKIRMFKAGNAGFSVIVKHTRGYNLSTAVRFCKDKAAVKVFMEQEVQREDDVQAEREAVHAGRILL